MYLLIYFWLHWVFVAVHGLSLVVASRGHSSCSALASHCSGLSCCGARAPGVRASAVVARGLSSCGAWAQFVHGMWDPPGPGIKPVSPALAGRFSTTVPPGKSLVLSFEIGKYEFSNFVLLFHDDLIVRIACISV